MTSASSILDRADNLQLEDSSSRTTAWLELVAAYVDDAALPAPEKINRLYRDCGKTRADLEKARALMREYRSLEAQLAQVPALQARVEQHSRDLAAALKAREAAEAALKAAQEEVSRIDAVHTGANRHLNMVRSAAITMRQTKFNAIRPVAEWSLSAEAQQFTAEIARIETRLAQLHSLTIAKRQRLTELDAAMDSYKGSDLPPAARKEQVDKLFMEQQGVQRLIDSYSEEEYQLKKELAAQRRELGELGSNQ